MKTKLLKRLSFLQLKIIRDNSPTSIRSLHLERAKEFCKRKITKAK